VGAPFPVLESYLGFMRDLPRHQLPGGILWDMVDWIPQLDGAARRRFGWSAVDASTFSVRNASATNYGSMVAYAPYTATGAEIVAVTSNGYLIKIPVSTGVGAYVGTVTAKARPVFHREKLVIMDQSHVPTFYSGNGAALTSASGGPQAACGTLFGDYTLLCNTAANPQRGYFSAAGDPTTWDTTNSWIDMPGKIIGVQGLRNAIIFFTGSQVWRVRGDTPPQLNVVGNLIKDHLYDTGLLDERSIATYGEQVVFANTEGIWLTDGAKVTNLAERGGILTYWQSLLKNYQSSWTIAGGVYRGYYTVSVSDGSGNNIDFLVCDLSQGHWFRFSDIVATMFAHATGLGESSYFVGPNGYVGNLANIWGVQSSTDQGGAVILPSLETPFFRGWQRFHRKWIPTDATSVWQRIYVNYDAPGAGSGLRLAYTTSSEAGAPYTTIGDLPTTTAPTRTRMVINPNGGAVPARGIGFKIYQAAGMTPTDLRLNDVELEYYTREGSR